MLEGTTGLDITKVNMGNPLVLVTRQQGKSYQDSIVRLPIGLEGMGMRSMVDFCLAAYIGGLEKALPHSVMLMVYAIS